jgi:3-oxoacyl-[acyl-carrier-protein] synthase II
MMPPENPREVVVTGCGAVSPIGTSTEQFWQSLRQGISGEHTISGFDTSALRNHVGCQIDDSQIPDPEIFRGQPRGSRLGAVAAREALGAAALVPADIDWLCVGTTMGDLPSLEFGSDDANEWSRLQRESFGARIAAAVGLIAPTWTVATSCAAGNVAICRAMDLVRSGRAQRVLAGGAEAFSRLAFIGFSRMRAMAPIHCAPFDRSRKGMLLGEGAAFLVVESRASAAARGVQLLAQLAGYGLSCDASHISTPSPGGRGAAVAIGRALTDACLRASDVDYVAAHGTGTVHNDLAEAQACAAVFGDHQPYVSSIKALTGHALGAAGALQAVGAVASLRSQRIIPAWHVDKADGSCPVRLALPDLVDDAPVTTIVSNAFAFGGNNSCLVLRRMD